VSALFELEDRVALVTGATGGLGRAITETLADAGAAVVLSDLDSSRCEQAAQGLRAAGHKTHAMGCDLRSVAAIDRLTESALAWQGRLDILVCNAGIQGPAGPLGGISAEDWDEVLAVNLRSAWRLTARLIPEMAQRGGGSVILISSIAGLRGNKSIGLYGVSKAGLAQLARNLAVEWGPHGVRVNALSPGLIRTPLSAGLMGDEAFISRRLSLTPLRRVGEPEEIAGVVVLLASRAGGFITGQNLIIDGGTTISDGN
jgi:NAD(P)-dependent dehydrogenase (short-subunit alcohol dehydrogenase family)